MSEPIKKMILAPSDALRQEHGIPKGKHIDGHKVTIKGLYFAVLKKTGEKVKREYSETIFFHPAEDLVHGQGALGRVLREKLLDEVLVARDPEFRSIHTHEVHEHENYLIDAPKLAPLAHPCDKCTEEFFSLVGLAEHKCKPAPRTEGEFRLGDKVLLPSGDPADTGVIVKLLLDEDMKKIGLPGGLGADVKLDVNGNVSPFALSSLKLAPAPDEEGLDDEAPDQA